MHATAHAPGVVAVGLIVVVHVAIVEVHVPRVGRILDIRRRRPVFIQDVGTRIAGREIGIPARILWIHQSGAPRLYSRGPFCVFDGSRQPFCTPVAVRWTRGRSFSKQAKAYRNISRNTVQSTRQSLSGGGTRT